MAVLPTGIGPVTGYNIERSLRFNSADTAYLNRTPAGAGNLQTWTWSGWVKRSRLGVDNETIFALFDYFASPTTNKQHGLRFLSGDTIEYWCYQDPSYNGRKITTQVFRDVSAWYHIVAVWDTPNATAANRMRLYVNGSEVTTFGTNTNPTQNSNGEINRAFLHTIGTFYDPDYGSPISSLNGYLTEVNFIGGQALTPSSFGETDTNTGVWKPKAFSGTYGTNGFYLNFSDNSNTTATTLGKDYSGNGNNWTPSGFSVASGAGNDSLVDTPTSYGTDTGVGGEVRGNYATLNPLDKGSNLSTVDGNLQVNTTTGSWNTIRSTIGITSGKFYWEFYATNTANAMGGITTSAASISNYIGSDAYGWSYNEGDGNKYNNGIGSAYGATYTTNNIIGVAFDADNGTLTFYKDNSSQGTAFTGLTSGPYFPAFAVNNSLGVNIVVNFGQRPFAHTAPSGYKALCTQNLELPTIGATSTTQANDYFDVLLETGTGSARSVTGLNFQPDFLWAKGSNSSSGHLLYDVVRGVDKSLATNTTAAEDTTAGQLTSFNSNGYSLPNDTSGYLNFSGRTYAFWNWNAGGSNQTISVGQYATSPVNVPSIASTVRANTTAGFSIVKTTGTGSAGTIGHGLGTAPRFIFGRNYSDAGGSNWPVYHASVGANNIGWINLTNAFTTSAATAYWNDTAPTSSVFSVGTNSNTNQSGASHIFYCFAPVAGYSAFGSYTGNGSTDGPFVFLGFRPRFIMIKASSSTGDWVMEDVARSPYNVSTNYLVANASTAEQTGQLIDFVSNGFKIRVAVSGAMNSSGVTYIYAAFAENPFKYSLAR